MSVERKTFRRYSPVMSTITLDELKKEPAKWALTAAQSGEPVLVMEAGQPLVEITAAARPVLKSSRLPDREEEICRMTVLPDSTTALQELRADRIL